MNIDLNCDIGEGMPHDAELMKYISSANIACGYHAGDEHTMKATVALCLKNNVAIGAHPGFNDKQNFGRASVKISDEELYSLVQSQLKTLDTICKSAGTKLHHVKPHGALYNMAAKDQRMSKVIVLAVRDHDASLIFYGLSNSFMINEAKVAGLKTANEVFGDRTYQSDGSLTPRTLSNAVITNVKSCTDQVMEMVSNGTVTTVDQRKIAIQAETLCIHGDEDHAVEFAKAIYTRLLKEGVTIKTIS